MKIRHRIALWITITGVMASLVLSMVILWEMVGEPYELIDLELEANAKAITRNVDHLRKTISSEGLDDNYYSPYWVKVTDTGQQLAYASESAGVVDLPLQDTTEGYVVHTSLLLRQVTQIEDDEDEPATFRVRVFKLTFSGQEYLVQIARPIENLDQELVELATVIGTGLALSALILILTSYYVSGRIIEPVNKINIAAREFSEKSLDTRIPLGRQKDEIYYLSSSLNSMFERLQFSFVRQKEFIANASHELRTPITLLRLTIGECLLDNALPQPLQNTFKKQYNSVLRMDKLVKDLLSLSSLELTDSLSPEEFLLNELTDSIIEDFTPLMKGKNIQFIAQEDDRILVSADREQIKRIFINLLENAVKYNRDGGEIRFKLWRSKHDGQVIIDLFNTGPGIPIEDKKRVFEQFYRVEKSRSLALGGVGLGLTITKKIIQLHGGTISLSSKSGSWAEFHITLPILVT